MQLTSLWLACCLLGDSLKAGDHERTLSVDDRERTYLVHVPEKYDGSRPLPVVLAFHGGANNARSMMRYSGLNTKADEAGFIVVYPNGTGRLDRVLTHNAGNCCGYARFQNVDDVGFTSALLDDLAKVAKIDAKRIYATGISNGGMMSYRLASELSDRIAAIASIAGTVETSEVKPARAVPILHFHGTKDEYVPIDGGVGPKTTIGNRHNSVPASLDIWIKINGCNKEPLVEKLPVQQNDGTTVTRKTYRSPTGKADVIYYEIDGGGHSWPGARVEVDFLGPVTHNISANDVMWEFFQRYSLP